MSWSEQIWLNAGRNICPVCGKEFFVSVPKEYIYKNKSKYYCSYTCWRAAQAPVKPLKGAKKKKGETK